LKVSTGNQDSRNRASGNLSAEGNLASSLAILNSSAFATRGSTLRLAVPKKNKTAAAQAEVSPVDDAIFLETPLWQWRQNSTSGALIS
jgi:hypothetical protein